MSKGRTSKASPGPKAPADFKVRSLEGGSAKKPRAAKGDGSLSDPKLKEAAPKAKQNKVKAVKAEPKKPKRGAASPKASAGDAVLVDQGRAEAVETAIAPVSEAGLVNRWVRKGQALGRLLAEHGAEKHEYRADLKEGRFVWMAPEGYVSAEAKAFVLCSWSRSTHVLVMAWADPLVRYASVRRIDRLEDEHDNIDEEQAWKLAMEAAELSGAEYLYRVPTPHAWYFLGLCDLQFDAALPSFRPTSPVGLVLRELLSAREAVESRAEPAAVTSERLSGFGRALVHQAEYAYRGTEWVERLLLTGKRLEELSAGLKLLAAKKTPKAAAVVTGPQDEQWLPRDRAVELIGALFALEDEWQAFEAQPSVKAPGEALKAKKGAPSKSGPH